MTQKEVNAFYEQHRGLVAGAAWQHSRLSGRPFSDALSDAQMSFIKAAHAWAPDKAKFTTFFLRVFKNDMIQQDLARKCKKRGAAVAVVDEQVLVALAAPEKSAFMDESDLRTKLAKLSDDARDVCEIVLSGDVELGHRCGQKTITATLRSRGWCPFRIKRAYIELRAFFGIEAKDGRYLLKNGSRTWFENMKKRVQKARAM